jgi:hypothetical protein
MSRHCKFTDELSIETGADGFRIYGGDKVERFKNLEDVDYGAEVVYLRDGLVHLFGRQNVYAVQFDSEVMFTVMKIAERYNG